MGAWCGAVVGRLLAQGHGAQKYHEVGAAHSSAGKSWRGSRGVGSRRLDSGYVLTSSAMVMDLSLARHGLVEGMKQ